MSRTRSKPASDVVEDPEAGVPIEQCLLVQEEIWRIVSEAARTETRLSLSKQARKIAGGFPAAGFSLQNIADALVFAAIDGGVAIKVTRPVVRQTIDVPGFLAFVGKKRKPQGEAKMRPTFAGVPIPATT